MDRLLQTFLSDTVGGCLASDLPVCYSERERLFIVEKMITDFKEIFTAMAGSKYIESKVLMIMFQEELMGYRFNIDVSGKLIKSLKLSQP